MWSQFRKCKSCSCQGTPYDTTSVMQYGTWAFQKDKSKPSMTKIGCPENEVWPSKKSGCRLGQYDGLNDSDIKELNLLYCGKTGPTTKPTCINQPDLEWACKFYASFGFCNHSYVDWMKKNCALACGCPS